MRSNLHESYARHDVKPPSERATGLVFATVALVVAFLWRNAPLVPLLALGVAVVLASVSLFAPRLLAPLNIVWFRLGLLLHRVVNPAVMLALFVLVFVPAGAIMRLWHDPLRLHRRSGARSYWIDRLPDELAAGSMRDQF